MKWILWLFAAAIASLWLRHCFQGRIPFHRFCLTCIGILVAAAVVTAISPQTNDFPARGEQSFWPKDKRVTAPPKQFSAPPERRMPQPQTRDSIWRNPQTAVFRSGQPAPVLTIGAVLQTNIVTITNPIVDRWFTRPLRLVLRDNCTVARIHAGYLELEISGTNLFLSDLTVTEDLKILGP